MLTLARLPIVWMHGLQPLLQEFLDGGRQSLPHGGAIPDAMKGAVLHLHRPKAVTGDGNPTRRLFNRDAFDRDPINTLRVDGELGSIVGSVAAVEADRGARCRLD